MKNVVQRHSESQGRKINKQLSYSKTPILNRKSQFMTGLDCTFQFSMFKSHPESIY